MLENLWDLSVCHNITLELYPACWRTTVITFITKNWGHLIVKCPQFH